ncbi:hypothetical protein VmeM32_00073 [Vibrio phage vB_VmeM-32]|nr:hypothetical protein VmeM32_00073 [Vibrio phage vB_VmeM-32]
MSNINYQLFDLMLNHSNSCVEYRYNGAYAGSNYAISVYYRCPNFYLQSNLMLLVQKYNLSINRHGDLIEVGYYDKKHNIIKYEARTTDLDTSIILCAIELWKQINKVKKKLTTQQRKTVERIIDGERYHYNRFTGSFGVTEDTHNRLYTTNTIRSLIDKDILYLDKDFNLQLTDFGKFVFEKHPINGFS